MSTFPTSGAYNGIPIPIAPTGVDPVQIRKPVESQKSNLENNYTSTGSSNKAETYTPESIRKRKRDEILDEDNLFEQEDMQQSMDILKDIAEKMGRKLRFEKDSDSGRLVIKVIDTITGEIIRQVPPEEILEMARKLKSIGRGWVDLVG